MTGRTAIIYGALAAISKDRDLHPCFERAKSMVTKIMPLGASNTYGMYQDPSSPGGYRGPLQDLLKAYGASYDFVGLDKDGAISDADHNGYSGKPIEWFTKPVNEGIYDRNGTYSHTINSGTQTAVQYMIDQADLRPTDVILLLAGTNNVIAGDSAETMLAKMDVLLQQIVSSPESPQVVLMKLQPVGGDWWQDGDTSRTNNDTIRIFNEGLVTLVADKYAALGVTLVDSGVTTSAGLSTDGVHMNATGYQMMADAWFKSLTANNQVEGPAPPQPTSPTEGTAGDDNLSGTVGDDIINGYAGNDTLAGRDGDDALRGGAGDDALDGGAGNDQTFGADGSDTLVLDAGNDLLDGGLGLDWVRVTGTTGASIDLSLTSAQATGYGTDTFLGIENAWGGIGADTLLGSTGANELKGDAGADTLKGQAGNDLLHGGADADDLDGGAGNDKVYGELGQDTLRLDLGDDILDGGEGSDWLLVSASTAATIDLAKTGLQWTGYGNDTIAGIENVTGGTGADKFYGTTGSNILEGRGGDDFLFGQAGGDTINGGAGKDTMFAGAGDGAFDVFVFTSHLETATGGRRDTIYEFQADNSADILTGDIIDLSGIDADTRTPALGDQTFGFSGTTAKTNSVWYLKSSSDLIIRGDVNGDTTADFEIRLTGVSALTASDFLL